MIVEFPCNTYLLSYTDRKNRQTDRWKDRQTGGKTDRQADRLVNKLKHIFYFLYAGEGGGIMDCGYGVDGRNIHLGRPKGI